MKDQLLALGLPQLAAIFVTAGAVWACWKQVWGILSQISNYVVGRAHLDHDTCRILSAYLSKKRMNTARPRTFGAGTVFVIRLLRRETVVFERLSDTTTFAVHRGVPIFLAQVTAEKSKGNPAYLTVYWLRGTLNIDTLLRDAPISSTTGSTPARPPRGSESSADSAAARSAAGCRARRTPALHLHRTTKATAAPI